MKYSFIEYLFVYLRCEVINMVVVVLKAATSFAGIDYNERKNEEGKSELLVAENFAMNPDNLKKSDYIAYMESVCRTNPAVKAKQFHAVISCKGREYSAEDLKNVALQYINKMGYGNNPYMIYFHSDTENNHVHIVSTRVQKNGQKVKDNMEAVRSQKVINPILFLCSTYERNNSLFITINIKISQFKVTLHFVTTIPRTSVIIGSHRNSSTRNP